MNESCLWTQKTRFSISPAKYADDMNIMVRSSTPVREIFVNLDKTANEVGL